MIAVERGSGMFALGGRAYCRRRAGRKTLQWKCLGIFRDLDGCCGGRGGWNNPRFTDWPTSSTADDGILQNVLGFLPLSKDGA